MFPWQKYVLECFKKEGFYTIPSDIASLDSMWRFASYEALKSDVLQRYGPIASATLSILFQPKVIVEFGVSAGFTSLLLCKLNPLSEVHGVDIVDFVHDVKSCPIGCVLVWHKVSNYTLHKMNSWEFDMKGKVDLCFIDGNHDEKSVWKDCWRAWENRNVDGDWCIAWDDYHPSNQGVTKSVDRFIKEIGYPLQKAWSWYWIGTKTMSEEELQNVAPQKEKPNAE